MPTQYFLPVIHPAFELLKKSVRMLHFIGASIILINGLKLLQEHESIKIICYLQIAITIEIYLVLFLGNNLLINSPGLGVFFRFIESLTLLGSGLMVAAYGYTKKVI